MPLSVHFLLEGEVNISMNSFDGKRFLLGVAVTIVVEGALSFLGLGVQAPQPSLGNMIIEVLDGLAANGDAGNGAAFQIGPRVFHRAGARVTAIHEAGHTLGLPRSY